MPNDSDVPQSAKNLGVVNPYALAELIKGRKINWNEVEARTVFEETFNRPYEELFDPQHGSPLYPGVRLTEDGVIERQTLREEDLDAEGPQDWSDPDVSDVTTVAEIADRMDVEDPGSLEVNRPRLNTSGSVNVDVNQPQIERSRPAFRDLPREILPFVTEFAGSSEEWTPSGAQWSDQGDFFQETAEWFDPIQGSVANCYYIAALGAVAWSHPYQIQQKTRATGPTQQDFVDMIEFHDNGSVSKIEVHEDVPVRNGNIVYARSRENGEIWPGVYEKAFAKLITGTSSDKPNIKKTEYGDCVAATDRLIGGSRSYTGTKNNSAGDLWSEVRGNSRAYKTVNPGTAWTYSSGSNAPGNINYRNANIVANHCYSVLGWDYDGGTKYIVCHNPWGRKEPSTGRMNGVWTPKDESFWRRINLPGNDGTFAIDASTFKQYFAGLGFVS